MPSAANLQQICNKSLNFGQGLRRTVPTFGGKMLGPGLQPEKMGKMSPTRDKALRRPYDPYDGQGDTGGRGGARADCLDRTVSVCIPVVWLTQWVCVVGGRLLDRITTCSNLINVPSMNQTHARAQPWLHARTCRAVASRPCFFETRSPVFSVCLCSDAPSPQVARTDTLATRCEDRHLFA